MQFTCSENEAAEIAKNLFSLFDKNKSGSIEDCEALDMMQDVSRNTNLSDPWESSDANSFIKFHDSDGDGKLTQKDIEAAVKRYFCNTMYGNTSRNIEINDDLPRNTAPFSSLHNFSNVFSTEKKNEINVDLSDLNLKQDANKEPETFYKNSEQTADFDQSKKFDEEPKMDNSPKGDKKAQNNQGYKEMMSSENLFKSEQFVQKSMVSNVVQSYTKMDVTLVEISGEKGLKDNIELAKKDLHE